MTSNDFYEYVLSTGYGSPQNWISKLSDEEKEYFYEWVCHSAVIKRKKDCISKQHPMPYLMGFVKGLQYAKKHLT